MQRLRGPAGAATSAPAAPWPRRGRCNSSTCTGRTGARRAQQLPVCASAAGDGGSTEDEQQESLREARRRLTRVFYGASAAPQRTSTSSGTISSSSQRVARQLEGAVIECLPLWRVEWAVLPGMQEILHVLAPHYLHMFEAVFSRPRPWVFGHLYLPGGSRSLGSSSHALASGSQSPLIGVLMQVTRAVRLRDGKLLVLATALGRFRVVRAVRELPYSEAHVELLEDVEVLESFGEAATAALMQSAASDEVSVATLMAASNAAAREAAAAAHWAWLLGYELKVALQQEWPGPGPCEGESDLEAYHLVQQLAEQGVAEVLPLPGGVVIGRVDLQLVAAAAGAAAQAALQRAAAQLTGDQAQQKQQEGAGVGPLSSSEGADIITSLNTTVQRGVAIQAPEWQELTGTSSTSANSLADVLVLEAAIWAELDILAALSSRVKGRRHSLPFGLLQLRPPRPQPGMGAAAAASSCGLGSSSSGSGASSTSATPPAPPAAEVASAADDRPAPPAVSSTSAGEASPGSSSSSSDGSSNSSSISSRSRLGPKQRQYALAASEGTDVHAEPLHPPLRRAAKLSWAAALATGQVGHDKGEQRQALLEACSLASRLRFVLAVLQKHKHVLAALAAVEDV